MAASRQAVCKAEALPEGKGESFQVGGWRLALFNVGGEFFAIEDRCSHADVPMADGFVPPGEFCVACPWHGAEFDLRTGAALSLPATEAIAAFPTSVEAGQVWVELPGD